MDPTLAALRDELELLRGRVEELAGPLEPPRLAPAASSVLAEPPPPPPEAFVRAMEALPSTLTEVSAFDHCGGEAQLRACQAASEDAFRAVYDPEMVDVLNAILPRNRNGKLHRPEAMHQRYVRSVDELYEHARAAEGPFRELILRVAENTGGHPVIPKLKGRERAVAKALYKYGTGVSEGAADDSGDATMWFRLTDIVRATIEYLDILAMYRGLQTIVARNGQDLRIREFNDRYQKPMPNGYRDIQLQLDVGGFLCELQLTTVAMSRAKETVGHHDYEVRRQLVAAVDAGSLRQTRAALAWGRKVHVKKDTFFDGSVKAVLHKACRRGFAAIMRELLDFGVPCLAATRQGQTVLHLAMEEGHEHCMVAALDFARLLGKGPLADLLDARDLSGRTALDHGYLTMKMRSGTRFQATFRTLLMAAGAERGRAAARRIDDEVRRRMHNSRALVTLAADGRLERVKAELSNFADPNSRDASGSALSAALSSCHWDVARLLLEFRCSTEASLRGVTSALDAALVRAVEEERDDFVDILLQHSEAGTTVGAAVRWAVQHRETSGLLERLLAKRVDYGEGVLDEVFRETPAEDAERRRFLVGTGGVSASCFLAPASLPPLPNATRDMFSGVVACEGRLYLIPFSSRSVVVMDGDGAVLDRIAVGSMPFKWSGGCLASDGKIYCAPFNHGSILVVDPATHKTLSIPTGTGGAGSFAGVCECDGKLFFCPRNASHVCVMELRTRRLRQIPVGAKQGKWKGIAALGTTVVAAPMNASAVLVIDAATLDARFVDRNLRAGQMQWNDICAFGGKFYCAPLNADSVLVFDAASEEISYIPVRVSGMYKFNGITALGSLIIAAPFRASCLLLVSPSTGTASTVACDDASAIYYGITNIGDCAYAAPSGSSVLKVRCLL